MEEWDVCSSERLQPDVRARIIGCKAQMERFDFFFGLHLGEQTTDSVPITEVAKEFVSRNENRKRNFGKFKE